MMDSILRHSNGEDCTTIWVEKKTNGELIGFTFEHWPRGRRYVEGYYSSKGYQKLDKILAELKLLFGIDLSKHQNIVAHANAAQQVHAGDATSESFHGVALSGEIHG